MSGDSDRTGLRRGHRSGAADGSARPAFELALVGVRGGLVGFLKQHAVGFEARGGDVGEIVGRDVHTPLQNTLRLQAEHECVIHRR